MNRRLFLAVSALLWAPLTLAHEYDQGSIHINHPWARPTAPGAVTGGGFMELKNTGNQADRLLSASAEVSDVVELHTHIHEQGVTKMRKVEVIDLPAGENVKLQPGGLHVMFIGLKAPLKEGDKFPVKLKFEQAGEITVDMNVEQPAQPMGQPHQHGKAMH